MQEKTLHGGWISYTHADIIIRLWSKVLQTAPLWPDHRPLLEVPCTPKKVRCRGFRRRKRDSAKSTDQVLGRSGWLVSRKPNNNQSRGDGTATSSETDRQTNKPKTHTHTHISNLLLAAQSCNSSHSPISGQFRFLATKPRHEVAVDLGVARGQQKRLLECPDLGQKLGVLSARCVERTNACELVSFWPKGKPPERHVGVS